MRQRRVPFSRVGTGREAWHETAAVACGLRWRCAGERRMRVQLPRERPEQAHGRLALSVREPAPGPRRVAAHLVPRSAVAPDARTRPRRYPVNKLRSAEPECGTERSFQFRTPRSALRTAHLLLGWAHP